MADGTQNNHTNGISSPVHSKVFKSGQARKSSASKDRHESQNKHHNLKYMPLELASATAVKNSIAKNILQGALGQGIEVLKHGRQGAAKQRVLYCDPGITKIFWTKRLIEADAALEKGLESIIREDRTIKVADILEVRAGTDLDPLTDTLALRAGAESGILVAKAMLQQREAAGEAKRPSSTFFGSVFGGKKKELLYGTATLRRSAKPEDFRECLSLITADRTVDIQCLSKKDFTMLYVNLKEIVNNLRNPIEIPAAVSPVISEYRETLSTKKSVRFSMEDINAALDQEIASSTSPSSALSFSGGGAQHVRKGALRRNGGAANDSTSSPSLRMRQDSTDDAQTTASMSALTMTTYRQESFVGSDEDEVEYKADDGRFDQTVTTRPDVTGTLESNTLGNAAVSRSGAARVYQLTDDDDEHMDQLLARDYGNSCRENYRPFATGSAKDVGGSPQQENYDDDDEVVHDPNTFSDEPSASHRRRLHQTLSNLSGLSLRHIYEENHQQSFISIKANPAHDVTEKMSPATASANTSQAHSPMNVYLNPLKRSNQQTPGRASAESSAKDATTTAAVAQLMSNPMGRERQKAPALGSPSKSPSNQSQTSNSATGQSTETPAQETSSSPSVDAATNAQQISFQQSVNSIPFQYSYTQSQSKSTSLSNAPSPSHAGGERLIAEEENRTSSTTTNALSMSPTSMSHKFHRTASGGGGGQSPFAMKAHEALQIGMILAQQEREFGTNMYQALQPDDEPDIERLNRMGYSTEEAILQLFQMRFHRSEDSADPHHQALKERSIVVQQSDGPATLVPHKGIENQLEASHNLTVIIPGKLQQEDVEDEKEGEEEKTDEVEVSPVRSPPPSYTEAVDDSPQRGLESVGVSGASGGGERSHNSSTSSMRDSLTTTGGGGGGGGLPPMPPSIVNSRQASQESYGSGDNIVGSSPNRRGGNSLNHTSPPNGARLGRQSSFFPAIYGGGGSDMDSRISDLSANSRSEYTSGSATNSTRERYYPGSREGGGRSEGVASPSQQRPRPSSGGGNGGHNPILRMSSTDALQIGLLLSQQESEFGINMYDSLEEADEVTIRRLVTQGLTTDEAVLEIFNMKHGRTGPVHQWSGVSSARTVQSNPQWQPPPMQQQQPRGMMGPPGPYPGGPYGGHPGHLMHPPPPPMIHPPPPLGYHSQQSMYGGFHDQHHPQMMPSPSGPPPFVVPPVAAVDTPVDFTSPVQRQQAHLMHRAQSMVPVRQQPTLQRHSSQYIPEHSTLARNEFFPNEQLSGYGNRRGPAPPPQPTMMTSTSYGGYSAMSPRRVSHQNTLSALNDAEAVRLALLLSQQEQEYGVNMYDALRPTDDPEIQRLVSTGLTNEEAILHVFELRFPPRMHSTSNSATTSSQSASQPISTLNAAGVGIVRAPPIRQNSDSSFRTNMYANQPQGAASVAGGSSSAEPAVTVRAIHSTREDEPILAVAMAVPDYETGAARRGTDPEDDTVLLVSATSDGGVPPPRRKLARHQSRHERHRNDGFGSGTVSVNSSGTGNSGDSHYSSQPNRRNSAANSAAPPPTSYAAPPPQAPALPPSSRAPPPAPLVKKRSIFNFGNRTGRDEPKLKCKEADLKLIMKMGYTQEQAAWALTQNQGNVAMAVDSLCNS